MNDKKQLVLFTRYPVSGETKTRLVPHLGPEAAAQFQRKMTEHTLAQARKSGAQIEVRYTGGSLEQMRGWLGPDVQYTNQGEGDLGERMERAFESHFTDGLEMVIIIGSDCPSNSGFNIQAAFNSLITNDCVIGPADDGGYYLIGLCRAGAATPLAGSRTSAILPADLFHNIDWGGGSVFEQTMNAASGLSVHQLSVLHDVDLPEDIPVRISVVIPTLNEEQYLTRTLKSVKEGFNVEIIVVDGGSTDGTKTISPDALECGHGRAAQQNMGAATATGEILLFLHADTTLPHGWDWIVRDTLSDPAIALGCFTFRIMEKLRGLKLVEDTANWRSRFWNLPYGDQGLFLRREMFEQAGGFPDMPIMEDYAFVRALRRIGKVVTCPEPALTSGRRWKQHGILKVTIMNKLMIAGYHLGIAPEKLASFYRGR